MILYIEIPENFTKKLLETINKYSEFAGYKINGQNPTAFLYNNNEISEKQMKKKNQLLLQLQQKE